MIEQEACAQWEAEDHQQRHGADPPLPRDGQEHQVKIFFPCLACGPAFRSDATKNETRGDEVVL